MQSRKFLFFTVMLLVIGLSAFWLINKEKDQNNPTDNSIRTEIGKSADGIPSDNSNRDGKYVAFSKGISEVQAGKRVVLYFYANWCPTCIPVDKEIQNNTDRIPEDVVIIKVNYNDSDTDSEEKELAKKHGVTYQHTFVELDDAGNAVQKWNGGSLDDVLKML